MAENGFNEGYKQGYEAACQKMDQIDNEFIADWIKFFPEKGPREIHAEVKELEKLLTWAVKHVDPADDEDYANLQRTLYMLEVNEIGDL